MFMSFDANGLTTLPPGLFDGLGALGVLYVNLRIWCKGVFCQP